MPKNFMQEMERIIKDRVPGQLETLMFYYAIPLRVFEQRQSAKETKVYGTSAGNISSQMTMETQGILVSTDFYESDSSYAGDFEQGFLYTLEPNIPVGSYIEIDRMDNKIKRFKIDSLKTIGVTTTVLHRYEILAVAD